MVPWAWKTHLVLVVSVAVILLLASPRRPRERDLLIGKEQLDIGVIDEYIRANMAAMRIPGLALAIVKDGNLVHVKGFGTADEVGRPVTPQTPFVVGSLSKPVAALAVMQLVEQGRVDLDAPVQKYIPWFSTADHNHTRNVTVRHLLNQTSGLPWQAGHDLIVDGGIDPVETVVRRQGSVTPVSPVGTHFEYSNLNYALLGTLVQSVSGMAYGDYVKQHILIPLSMTNTFVTETEAIQGGLATGYRSWFGYPVPFRGPFLQGALSSGYLVSSAEDFAKLLAALQSGTEPTVLSPEGIQELLATPPHGLPYGYGWFHDTLYRTRALRHEGDAANYHAATYLLPDHGWAVVVLTNLNGIKTAGPAIDRLAWGVGALLTGNSPDPVAQSYWWRQLFVNSTILLGVTLLALWSVWLGELRTRWIAGSITCLAGIVLPALLSGTVGLVGISTLPRLVQVSWSVVFRHQPDIGWATLLGLGALLARGLVHLVGTVVQRI